MRSPSRRGKKLVAIFSILVAAASVIGYTIYKNTSASALAEVNPDIWSLSYGLYDPDVDEGRTKITDLDWHIPSSKQGEYIEHEYLFQLKITAPVVDREYAPGELQIKATMPLKGTNVGGYDTKRTITNDLGENWDYYPYWTKSINIGARPSGSSIEGYDWEYICDNGSGSKLPTCTFTNLKTIEQDSSMEGNIDFRYVIYRGINNGAPMFKTGFTTEITETGITAKLNDTVESNPISTSIKSDYEVEWQKEKYDIHERIFAVDSYDNLGADATNYTWLKYYIFGYANIEARSPYAYEGHYGNGAYDTSGPQYNRLIPEKDYDFYSAFSPNVKVLDRNKNELTRNANGEYVVSNIFTKDTSRCKELNTNNEAKTCYELYVGYPKDQYNETLGTNIITTTADSRGTYWLEDDEVLLATVTKEYNLNDFQLTYQGNQVSVDKELLENQFGRANVKTDVTNEAIRSEAGATAFFELAATTKNIESYPYSLELGDDLLYIKNLENGEVSLLNEDDYSITKFNVPKTLTYTNGDNYNCYQDSAHYYYRIRGESDFHELDYHRACTGGSNANLVTLPDGVVEFKARIDDLNSGIYNYELGIALNIKSKNLPRTGEIFNFDYVSLIYGGAVRNTASLSDYGEGITQRLVAAHDQEKYGTYRQRDYDSVSYEPIDIGEPIRHPKSEVSIGDPNYNSGTDGFDGYIYSSYSILLTATNATSNIEAAMASYPKDKYISELHYYVVAPKGMEITSTPEEIANSINECAFNSANAGAGNFIPTLYKQNGELLFQTKDECVSYVREHTNVRIENNWRNTGQTRIKISMDFSENPFMRFDDSVLSQGFGIYNHKISYHIPYEVYLENEAAQTGDNHHRYIAIAWAPNDGSFKLDSNNSMNSGSRYRGYSIDDGHYTEWVKWDFLYNRNYADIDDDGDTSEEMEVYSDDLTLTPVASTMQSLRETVYTDLSGDYTTSNSYTSPETTYNYKLAVKTGDGKATNVVLYTNLEQAYEDNPHWQGTFAGIDTSFAEQQLDDEGNALHIKTYYSPNADAGSLSEDNSWQEYSSAVSATSVKSLAFVFQNAAGQPAVLPSNSFAYVLVNMTAPEDAPEGYFAYNNFRSEWNALNIITNQPIQDITGIHSNTTRVALNAPLEIHVINRWIDDDDALGLRPDSIVFDLKRYDQTLADHELDAAPNEDNFDFTNLTRMDKDYYDVITDTIDEYETTVEFDRNTMTFTLTHRVTRQPEEPEDPSALDAPTDNPVTAERITRSAAAALITMLILGTAFARLKARR